MKTNRKYAYQVKIARVGKRTERVKLEYPTKLAQLWSQCVEPADWFEHDKEAAVVVSVDCKLNLLSWSMVSIGTSKRGLVCPIQVFRPAIMEGAHGIFFMHNHPSGCSQPSKMDWGLTNTLRASASILGLEFYDHVVIGDGEYCSFIKNGVTEKTEYRKLKVTTLPLVTACQLKHFK